LTCGSACSYRTRSALGTSACRALSVA
jgi:hypothetical protein